MGEVLSKQCVMIDSNHLLPVYGVRMPPLDKSEIEKIAWLARLMIEDADIPGYVQDLNHILQFIEQMNSVDTTIVEPMAHPLEIKARLRADEVTEPDLRDKYQRCAPAVTDGLYMVPKVIE
jgi:aspartyl-tRNA(Asn)/glutamyl-tRNA(Gln) amidotransferase subunit C